MAKFIYRMQSILDIKSKMEEQAKQEFATARMKLSEEEDKLENLKSVRRIEVAERIKQAIDFGDISENSEYDDAKNEQAFIEGEIMDLEKKLRNVEVIQEDDKKKNTVHMGNCVVIRDLEFNDDFEYTLVGSAEADPTENKISNESPVGEAILGKKVGATVEVNVPAGILKYKIVKIKS